MPLGTGWPRFKMAATFGWNNTTDHYKFGTASHHKYTQPYNPQYRLPLTIRYCLWTVYMCYTSIGDTCIIPMQPTCSQAICASTIQVSFLYLWHWPTIVSIYFRCKPSNLRVLWVCIISPLWQKMISTRRTCVAHQDWHIGTKMRLHACMGIMCCVYLWWEAVPNL